MGRFIQTQKADSFDSLRKEEMKKSLPVFDKKRKLVFVNGSKFKRAESILATLLGQKAVVKTEELQRKDHYARQIEAYGIDLQSEDALPAIYELLGGLIRTPEEQKHADEKAIDLKTKGKKKMIDA